MFALTRKRKIAILIVVDLTLIACATIAGYLFLNPFIPIPIPFISRLIISSMILYLIFGYVFRVFTRINRYTNLREILAILLATTGTALGNAIYLLSFSEAFSKRLILFTYILSAFFIILSRLAWRLFVERRNMHTAKDQPAKRTLIVGAGEGGRVLYNSFLGSKTASDIQVVGFVDDDPNKQKVYLSNVKVLGKMKDLPQLVGKYQIDMVTIAIPSLPRKRLREVFDLLENNPVTVNTMPSMEEMAAGKINISKLKEIDVVDLLGRDEAKLDVASIKDQITDKIILVTGAGGSIGSEITRQVIQFNPRQLILLGHGENSIYLIHRELSARFKERTTELVPIIADVQNREKIFEVMSKYQPDIVYHAAAHKHVPLMEFNPKEAVKNNVYGTKNVAEAAKAHAVEQFVMVSTDKANNPPNVMGATKRIAEMIVTGMNEKETTKFSAVRFGNVLGSRGSVIPLFREQLANGGPLTVTDFRMTRYFMTIPEASRLVIQSGALAKGGEVFVLDMHEPVKILDLAKNMVRLSGYSEDDIEIVETGIRPGEKLYEELLLDKERSEEQVHDQIFVGNVNGYSLDEVLEFVNDLPEGEEQLAHEVVDFANSSNR
ncbi:polysaccharide biosynthesis protein [Tetragenococcus koreensis]|uniref:polysaccharide biosynthesis protein n=1 Tax=Tetragenococcus koreensis TaxID=290335 RepID=UPI001F2A71C4|nr:nucleoside-diphosphate sugar epimerase/dehydratase [Tetragenococcus koreensis]MCF1617088.1 polysaccharide biosynthesis protein [Tetragenococcus koreensis]MCF1621981.1 polysaccharide biosynthesis protein [Tetragenococcus koreensis]MCF1641824.1 polysaccharide biosynthesis protein [Tetragenococcus koreensis]MCF1678051.1 polysaccharide biosynthesis protein [Tetragenococcus koreensis]MCF1682754.1 polysaccharide biosynthesis protein [Tetragenococcus koreensis]